MSDTRKMPVERRSRPVVATKVQRSWTCDECRQVVPMAHLADHILTHPDHVGYTMGMRQ